jgi:hypothetical protein
VIDKVIAGFAVAVVAAYAVANVWLFGWYMDGWAERAICGGMLAFIFVGAWGLASSDV